jgi:chorismate dehydratase
MIEKLKVTSVPYTNAVLLTHFLPPDLIQLDFQIPSEMAKSFAEGRHAVALLPVFELFEHAHYRVIPGMCIGSTGAVKSVCLFYEGDLQKIKRVRLDASSRTSNALVQVVLEKFLGLHPEFVRDSEDFDAELRIGDPALNGESRFNQVLDLGEVWKKHTGKGFAYALWTTADSQNLNGVAAVFKHALGQGQKSADAIIDQLVKQKLFTKAVLDEYLKVNIHYDFDANLQAGLKLFYQYCFELGLVKNPWELKYYEPKH